MSSGVTNVRQPFQYSAISVQLFLQFSCIPRLARESDRPPIAHTAKPKTAGGRQRGHRLTGATHGRGVRARVGLSIPPGAGPGRGRARGGVARSASRAVVPLSALGSGRGPGRWDRSGNRQKIRAGNPKQHPPYRKKVDFPARGQRVRRHRTQNPHASEPYIRLDCQAS